MAAAKEVLGTEPEHKHRNGLISYQVNWKAVLDNDAKPLHGSLIFSKTDIQFVPELPRGRADKTVVPFGSIEKVQKQGGGLGLGLAKPFLIHLTAWVQTDESRSKSEFHVDFGKNKAQRDHVMQLLEVYGIQSEAASFMNLSGSGHCQYEGKGEFFPLQIELQRDGQVRPGNDFDRVGWSHPRLCPM